jgi:hypothetical protein
MQVKGRSIALQIDILDPDSFAAQTNIAQLLICGISIRAGNNRSLSLRLHRECE